MDFPSPAASAASLSRTSPGTLRIVIFTLMRAFYRRWRLYEAVKRETIGLWLLNGIEISLLRPTGSGRDDKRGAGYELAVHVEMTKLSAFEYGGSFFGEGFHCFF